MTSAKYYANNREQLRKAAKERYAAGENLKQRNRTTKRTYGITLDDIETMVEEQDGLCLICGLPFEDKKYSRSVDHDHRCCPGKRSCGKCIRGILHPGCNQHLGTVEMWHSMGRISFSLELQAYVDRRHL